MLGDGLRLSNISFGNIKAHHSVTVEIISVFADRILHHPDPCFLIVII